MFVSDDLIYHICPLVSWTILGSSMDVKYYIYIIIYHVRDRSHDHDVDGHKSFMSMKAHSLGFSEVLVVR